MSFDLGLLLKEHWEKLVIAVGGLWYVFKELLTRFDTAKTKARADARADQAAKRDELKTDAELAREGLNLAFRSMEKEIERLTQEVSGLNGRIDVMQQDFSEAQIAKDADLRAAQAENRQLRADYDAIGRTLAKCAEAMIAAGLTPPIVPKVFQAVQISAAGEISTMGTKT